MSKTIDRQTCRALLWVRAVEEHGDSQQRELLESADVATELRGKPFARLRQRARLLDRLLAGHGFPAPRLPRSLSMLIRLAPFALFVLGLAGNSLGMGSRVNLFYNPLVLLIYWQIVVYVFWLSRMLLGGTLVKRANAMRPMVQAVLQLMRRLWRPGQESAQRAYVQWWLRASRRDAALRILVLFHLGYIALVLGSLAGLYLRGLVVSYAFVWESTFLKSPALFQSLINGLFWLPAKLLGAQIPQLASASGAAMPGAGWIHVLAAAVTVYVLIPRLLLVALNLTKMRAGRALDFDDSAPYYQAILAEFALRETARIRVYVYSLTLDQAIRTRLADQIGALVSAPISWLDVPWEAEVPDDASGDQGVLNVVVFNGVQTPEYEVHGAFLDGLRAHVDRNAMLVVDGRRVPDSSLTTRRELWNSLAQAHGFGCVAWLDGGEDASDVAALVAAVRGFA